MIKNKYKISKYIETCVFFCYNELYNFIYEVFMDKLSKFVSNPIVILVTYILTFIGVILALSQNVILQIVSIGIMTLCIIIGTIFFIRFKCDVAKEKYKIKQNVQKIYFNQADAGIEKTMELVQTMVNNSLSMKQTCFSEDHFKSVCKDICTSIRSILLNVCGIDFSVCIKQIITNELVDCNYSKVSTQTIARSGHKTIERSQNDSIPQQISNNTSFKEILENDRLLVWSSPNLKNTIACYKNLGKEYENPDKNYSNYYNSTLVVPIRIRAKYISPIILKYTNNTKTYNCIAFLCADSPKEFDGNDEAFKLLASKILRACGDALYPLFENKLTKEIESI